jgi:hypothetical protein
MTQNFILQDGRLIPSDVPVIDLQELGYFKARYPMCAHMMMNMIRDGRLRIVPSMEYCFHYEV